MRQGWVVGFFMFYFLIWGIAMLVTSGTTMSESVLDNIKYLLYPITTSAAGDAAGAWAYVSNAWEFFTHFFGALTLWFPTSDNVLVSLIWTGNLLWVYVLFVLAIVIGMIVSIVTILRGSSAS